MAAGYHGHPVVRAVDLVVEPGEIVGLLGPNGAGKTTTLNALAGYLPILGGEVRWNGNLTRAPMHARARDGLAYVTERRSVFMKLSTADNLRVGRCDRALAVELFPELEKLMDRTAGQLSGGEQQMLTLGRALARRPKLLLADELSQGLAPIVVTRLLEAALKAAREDNVGILIVEQHVNQALEYADRIYAMRRGEIVLKGTATEIAPRLQEAYIA